MTTHELNARNPQGPVLVVGGAGYIGSHTVRLLAQRGVPVAVLDNLSTGHRAAIDVPLEQVDLADQAGLDELFGRLKPRSVIHFAAKCYVGESVEKPALYYRENVFNTWNLLEAMRANGCREIIFSSTAATYGEPVELPITEEHPQQPINPYGKTKLHMEHMMADYVHAYGFRAGALRYFNAAGCDPSAVIGEDHEPETHLIPLVLQVAQKKREKIMLFGTDYPTPDGSCVRDYIHVNDLADAHLRGLCLLQDGTQNFACNLGTGEGVSVRELVELAREVTGEPIQAEDAPRRPGDPAVLVADGSKAARLLGWKAQRSDIRSILADAWKWHTTHPDGYGDRAE